MLCEYCLPLVKVGGRFVSLKGSNGLEELEASKNAIMVLGGEIETAESYVLPNGDGRTIFVIKKISKKLIPDRSKYNGICRIIMISHDEKSFIFVILYGIFISRSERRGANRSNTYGKAVT